MLYTAPTTLDAFVYRVHKQIFENARGDTLLIAFVRSYLSDYDSRIRKFFRCAELVNEEFMFIGWARAGADYEPAPYKVIYRSGTRIGARWGNFIGFLRWQRYLLATLYKHREKIAAVHCADLDTALVGYLFCWLFRKKFIFDIYDQYSSSRGVSGYASRIMNCMESYLAREAHLCIIAAEERVEQHRLQKGANAPLILENVPLEDLGAEEIPEYSGTLHIGYFGVLERRHRGIEDLVAFASSRADIHLHIAGYGAREQEVRLAASRSGNITYYGPMQWAEGVALMRQVHVIGGFYYLSNPNHAYAAPNKYYEHLMLGRGLLTTRGTPPGQRVERHGSGWAIEEGLDPLNRWIAELHLSDMRRAGMNARALWETRYRDYFQEHYVGRYGRHISQYSRSLENA